MYKPQRLTIEMNVINSLELPLPRSCEKLCFLCPIKRACIFTRYFLLSYSGHFPQGYDPPHASSDQHSLCIKTPKGDLSNLLLCPPCAKHRARVESSRNGLHFWSLALSWAARKATLHTVTSPSMQKLSGS